MERRLTAILAADVVGYSRRMAVDEAGTLAQLKIHRNELIEPKTAEYHGRVVKLMGDGTLMEFGSVVDAVRFAVDVQQAMAERNAKVPDDRRIAYRIGINIGDIIVEGDDIYGDGVNVAARLEGLAEPGGICVSRTVFNHVKGKVDLDFEDLGEREIKNIPEPVHVFKALLDGEQVRGSSEVGTEHELEQEIRYCTASDGVRIAYSTVGRGPPLVKTANWLNHLEYDWESPIWSKLLRELAKDHLLVRYDERGNGLSDWDVEDISFESFVRDLEAVVDEVGLERFPLIGISQGCPVSIAYAARHPERVSRLVLYGGYALGALKRQTSEEGERQAALMSVIKAGWGQDNPAFRQVFTSLFIPEGTPEQMQWFNDLQRMTTSAENAVRLLGVMGEIDVQSMLPQINVPTLVMHCRDDARVPFEQGRQLAMSIPGARFVPLEGQNHLMLGHEPGWPRFLAETKKYLSSDAD